MRRSIYHEAPTSKAHPIPFHPSSHNQSSCQRPRFPLLIAHDSFRGERAPSGRQSLRSHQVRLSSLILLRVFHSRLNDRCWLSFHVGLIRWWRQGLALFGSLMVLQLDVMVLSRTLSADFRLATGPGEEDKVQDPAHDRGQLGTSALKTGHASQR